MVQHIREKNAIIEDERAASAKLLNRTKHLVKILLINKDEHAASAKQQLKAVSPHRGEPLLAVFWAQKQAENKRKIP